MKYKTALFLSLILAQAYPVFGDDLSNATQSVQGAESQVNGSLPYVAKSAHDVFQDLGVSQTGVSIQDSGTNETIKGKKGDLSVEVQLSRTSAGETHVGIIAKRGAFNWDKDFARNVLSKIVQKG